MKTDRNEGQLKNREQAAAEGSSSPPCVLSRMLWWLLLVMLGLSSAASAAASFDDLLFDASRYGNTPKRRARKEAAREELFARGPEALQFLMGKVHIENLSIRLLVEQLVQRLEAGEGAPVLVEFLRSEIPVTRKFAVYFLGYYDQPVYAAEVLPFLADEEACGAALRTLGKWGVAEATPQVATFLKDPKERRRVAAANALRDLGDPRAIPSLLEALRDPVFTVRNTAQRALESLAPASGEALEGALTGAEAPARRHIIRALGRIRRVEAVGALTGMLSDADSGVRGDAARALCAIDPERGGDLVRSVLGNDDPDPFVRAALVATAGVR